MTDVTEELDKQNPILPLSLRFADPGLESDFQAWQLVSLRRVFLSALAILIPITLNNLAIDYRQGQGASLSSAICGLRIATLICASIGLTLLLRTSHIRFAGNQVQAVLVLLMTTTLVRGLTEPDYFTVGFISQMFYVFIVYLLCPFSWLRQVTYAGLFSLACFGIWEYRIEFTAELHRLGMGIPFANLLGATLARQRHRQERQLFASERRRAQQLELVRQLQKQQSEVLDFLTHELRHPFANIAAQAELIRRLHDPEAIRGLAERIIQTSNGAASIIGEWLAGDRIAASVTEQVGVRDIVSPLDVVHEAVRQSRVQHPGMTFEIREQDVPPVLIERRVLALALHNLLENAARHGRSVRGVVIHFRITPGLVTVRVRDYGQGLDIDDQDRIFQKHVCLNKSAGQPRGCGVGLFLVREMLARCGARIRVQSLPGRGSAFLIELLRAD